MQISETWYRRVANVINWRKALRCGQNKILLKMVKKRQKHFNSVSLTESDKAKYMKLRMHHLLLLWQNVRSFD